jgi:threonine dehydrogenase-like Zn-dependent dehydrogenase
MRCDLFRPPCATSSRRRPFIRRADPDKPARIHSIERLPPSDGTKTEKFMKALVWHGKSDIRCDTVPDPIIQDPRDIIIKVTSTAICGSDLHLYNGLNPTMESGDIMGHEPMGEIVDTGSAITNLRKGDRVVVPFTLSCGSCFFCDKTLFSLCDNTNPNEEIARKALGHSPAGLIGFSHMFGGYAGGQAQYLRVPFADISPIKIPDGIPDEKVLFLSDIFPTGYMAAENAEIEPGDTVAIWGCGPVAQFAIQSAWMFGAGRVIAIDHVPERLAMAEKFGKAETIDFSKIEGSVYERLMEMTGGRGPDRCIDAVGAEAHGSGAIDAIVDRAKMAVSLATDRPHALREAMMAVRKGGTISVPGVYMGLLDKMPFGAVMNKGITIRSGQTHVPRYLETLLGKIQGGEIDPSFVITHHRSIEEGPDLYNTFRDKEDGCIKVVLDPWKAAPVAA